MEELVGRYEERKIMNEALKSSSAELFAIYGRRRIGKTFLIKNAFKERLIFEFSGTHQATVEEQLKSFCKQFPARKKKFSRAVPESWADAFDLLQQYIAPLIQNEKKVIFFDEFPWIETRKSGFLNSFAHFWNVWGSLQPNLIVVICGSAASWMIQNIVNNKGGLHNRITRKIRLLPFNLSETEEFLKSRSVILSRYQILQIYMAMGGIPQYLKWILPGESASQAVDRLCFTKDGMLKEEFKILYLSLFEKAQRHIDIVKALSQKGSGLKRNEIIEACNLSTGGTTTKILEELEESGFINAYIPFGKNAREMVYKLADEYSLFYLKFIENTRTTGIGTWLRLSSTPSWRSWSGISFERICLKHIEQIKKGLGISAVQTTESIWRLQPKKDEAGAQIDLLIDRSDQCINLCEMKFSDAEFVITKEYESDLRRKSTVFKSTVKTRKTIFITLITTYGVKQNIYFTGNVQSQLTMEDLFGK